MAQIIWKLVNGEIAITALSPDVDPTVEAAKLQGEGLLPSDWVVDHVRPDDAHVEIGDPAFLGALIVVDGDVIPDMVRARDIFRDWVRAARLPEFTRLDARWMLAQDRNDSAAMAAVSDGRQVLRDLPAMPEIDLANTFAELRACWPATLSPLT